MSADKFRQARLFSQFIYTGRLGDPAQFLGLNEQLVDVLNRIGVEQRAAMPVLGLANDGVVRLRFELVDQCLADNSVVALGMQQQFAAAGHGLLRNHILIGEALTLTSAVPATPTT